MILALDLATRTGWCAGVGDRRPEVGHYTMAKTRDDVGQFLIEFETWMRSRIHFWQPDLVVFESPFVRAGDTAYITRKLHALPGVAEMVCIKMGVEVRQVTPKQAKKALTGNGNAKKPDMVAAAAALGVACEVDDEADAFGVWLCALRDRRRDAEELIEGWRL